MDVGFILLCPDKDIKGLKNSLSSIAFHCYNRECIAVVGDNATPEEMKELKEVCPTYKGENTITSLINLGMKKLKHEWAFLMFGGSRVQTYLERKVLVFATQMSDVLYPVGVSDSKWNFVDTAFNGVLINTPFFSKVGDFPTLMMEKDGFNDFELSKLLWAMDAMKAGVTFKAIAGMKVG